jgi:GDP-L-fucose synthase
MKETELLTGLLEPTNEPYAIAKIAGIKLCESYNRQFGKSHEVDYRSLMPTNLYGPGDNFDPENSHVIPGLIYRFHEAKIKNLPNVIIWGTGTAKREFLFVDDMVSASIKIMNVDKQIYEKYSKPRCSHINVGSGFELTIIELSKIIKKVVGYNGKIKFDKSKPDGSPRKLVDSNLINQIGFKPKVHLEEGIIKTYKNFLKEQSET